MWDRLTVTAALRALLVFLCTVSQITDDKFLVRTPLWYFMCAARHLRVH